MRLLWIVVLTVMLASAGARRLGPAGRLGSAAGLDRRQFELSRCRFPVEGAAEGRPRPGRRVAAGEHRLRRRCCGEPFERRDAQGVQSLLRQDQARLGRPGVLQRLRHPVGAAELHHSGRRTDLDRGRRPARRRQSRYHPQGDEYPRRQGQNRRSRCVAAKSVRAALSAGVGRTCSGRCADRLAGDVLLGAEHRRQRHRQRASPVRQRTRRPASRAGIDGRRGFQSRQDGCDPRLERAAGALAFVIAGVGFLVCPAARRRRSLPPPRRRRCSRPIPRRVRW